MQETACNAGDVGWILGSWRSPREENGYHSSILAWDIPWTEDPVRLQSMVSVRIRQNLVIKPQPPSVKWTLFRLPTHSNDRSPSWFISSEKADQNPIPLISDGLRHPGLRQSGHDVSTHDDPERIVDQNYTNQIEGEILFQNLRVVSFLPFQFITKDIVLVLVLSHFFKNRWKFQPLKIQIKCRITEGIK